MAGTTSRVERRGAGHTKTSPAIMQLTTLAVDHYSGACHVIGFIVQDTGSFAGALVFIGAVAFVGAISCIFGIGELKPITLKHHS